MIIKFFIFPRVIILYLMCKKLYLSFDSPEIGANFRSMYPLMQEGLMGGAEVELVN